MIKRFTKQVSALFLIVAMMFCAGCPKDNTKTGPANPQPSAVDSVLVGEISGRQIADWKNAGVLGDTGAAFSYAVCVYAGDSVEKDEKEAMKLFEEIKDTKDVGIQKFLKRIEIKADEAKVAEWTEAAKKGDADAMINVAISCFLGEGVKEDRVQAVKWAHAASTHQEHDGVLSSLEGRLGERLSFRQLGYARRLAREEGLVAASKE
jgi:hypothetical protein